MIFFYFALTIFLPMVASDSYLGCSSKTGYSSTAIGFYPSNNPSDNDFYDCRHNKLQTLQEFLNNEADYVSVAMDENLNIAYGTELCIPELNEKYKKNILFKVVDNGSLVGGKKYSLVDICVAGGYDSSVSGPVTLYFTNLQTGSATCH